MGWGRERKRSKKEYLNDYQKTASGDYVYVGGRFEFASSSGKTLKAWTGKMMLLTIGAIVSVLIPGLMRVPGMDYCWYVLIPYVANIVAIVYMMVALVRIVATKGYLNEWENDRGVGVLPKRLKIAIAAAIVNVPCEIIYLAINGAGKFAAGAAAYIIFHAVAAVLMIFALKTAGEAEWVPVTD